jgi:hypothetical protein
MHFFVVYKAKQLLPTIVSRISDGRYTMTSAKVRFNYFSPYIKLIDAHLSPATPGMDEEYEVRVDSLYISNESILLRCFATLLDLVFDSFEISKCKFDFNDAEVFQRI